MSILGLRPKCKPAVWQRSQEHYILRTAHGVAMGIVQISLYRIREGREQGEKNRIKKEKMQKGLTILRKSFKVFICNRIFFLNPNSASLGFDYIFYLFILSLTRRICNSSSIFLSGSGIFNSFPQRAQTGTWEMEAPPSPT